MRSLLLRDFQLRWLDYLLGSLLIAVVAGALLSQRSVSSSAEARMHELAHHLGKNMLVLPSTMDRASFHQGDYGKATMPAEYAGRLQASGLSAHIRESWSLLYGNIRTQGSSLVVMGMDPWHARNDQAYLGRAASSRLSLASGESVSMHKAELSIAEVLDSPPDGLDQGVFTSLATAQGILGKPDSINALQLGGCWCSIDVVTLAKEVEKLLPGTQAITVTAMVKAQKGTLSVMKRYSTALHLVGFAAIVATIALLLFSQVRRSLPELGLLLAMGASPGLVSGLFVLKSTLIGATGGILGYFLSLLLTRQVGARLLGLPLDVSPQAFFPLLGACTALSILAAALPAWRASQLDPAEVLRND